MVLWSAYGTIMTVCMNWVPNKDLTFFLKVHFNNVYFWIIWYVHKTIIIFTVNLLCYHCRKWVATNNNYNLLLLTLNPRGKFSVVTMILMIRLVTMCLWHSNYSAFQVRKQQSEQNHSTVTDFAKFRGQSTCNKKKKELRKQYYLLFTSIHNQQLKCLYFFL